MPRTSMATQLCDAVILHQLLEMAAAPSLFAKCLNGHSLCPSVHPVSQAESEEAFA